MNSMDENENTSKGNYGMLGKEFEEFNIADQSKGKPNGNGSAKKSSVIETSGMEDSPNLEVILDIPVTVSMEVGNAEMSIRDLLKLNQGSVVELDRLAGDSLDVLVNGTLIAHGEVVVVDDKFGIRLTDIVSPSERISRLR